MAEPSNVLEDPRTAATVYVVEATSDEAHALWREYSEEAKQGGWGSPGIPRVPWKQDGSGWAHVIGHLAGFPINISFTYARIFGQVVLFWSPVSRVVDWDACEQWMREHVPAYADHHTNSANFGHCLSHLRRG